MKIKINALLCFLFLASPCFADNQIVQRVQIEPLSGVSISTVTVNTVFVSGNAIVTVPTVAYRGRKELLIKNTATTGTVYLSKSSDSTVASVDAFPLDAGQTITLKLTSDTNIFATALTVQVLKTWEIR